MDYSCVAVDGTRVGDRIVIPEFVTFKRFSERADSKLETGEPEQTMRIRFRDYEQLRDSYRASGTHNSHKINRLYK